LPSLHRGRGAATKIRSFGSSFPELGEESEVGLAESSNVAKDRLKVCVPDANPGGKGGAVLVHGDSRYPAAPCVTPSLVSSGPLAASVGKTVPLGPVYRRNHRRALTAHDELVRAPRVIGPQILAVGG
jgi:hypothetical protein